MIVIAAFSLLLSGCAMTTMYQSGSTAIIPQRQKFVSTVYYCQNCYVTFSDISDLKTFSKHLNCPDAEMIYANPNYSLYTVIHNGEVIHLPDACRVRQSPGLAISPVTAAITDEASESSSTSPIILRNNYCSVWISPNRYSRKAMALVCPTLYKPLSLRKCAYGGVVVDTDSKDKVLASAAGQVVVSSSSLKKYGNLIVIRHGYDYASVYSHLGSTLVKNGDLVQVGQPIGTPLCIKKDVVDCSFDFSVRFHGHILPLRLALRGVHNDTKSRKDKESQTILKKDDHSYLSHKSSSSKKLLKTTNTNVNGRHGKKRFKEFSVKIKHKPSTSNHPKHEKTKIYSKK